jgi:hypothetical protein
MTADGRVQQLLAFMNGKEVLESFQKRRFK